MESVRTRLEAVLERIERASIAAGRPAPTLIAVTKTVPVERIRVA